jgi:hypothetical protein
MRWSASTLRASNKEWKEGPDNLWALNDNQYVIWEGSTTQAKPEVLLRESIEKGFANLILSEVPGPPLKEFYEFSAVWGHVGVFTRSSDAL